MRTIHVSLRERSYAIRVGSGLLATVGAECRKLNLGRRCAVISDTRVAPLFSGHCLASLRAEGFDPFLVTVPAGETAKSLRQVEHCYGALAAHRLERKSFVVALGGGVVGDLAGFVAATYLRGLNFVQIPTTLLAQVDSSVGGKVGINLKAGKNLVGAFHQPRLVLCDLDTLRTLSAREFRAGLAEVIKYGVIYDAAFFRRLERGLPKLLRRDSPLLASVVARCCAIKADVVGQDETESGLRAILNFGHTLGHAVEAVAGYGEYLHGEAISIGQIAAARLSTEFAGLPATEARRITTLFRRAGLPTQMRLPARHHDRLLKAMRLDKKVSDGEMKFVLAKRIGAVTWGNPVPETAIRKVMATVSRRA